MLSFAGDASVALGQLAEALAAYRDSLAIAQRLAAADPSNAVTIRRGPQVGRGRLGFTLRL